MKAELEAICEAYAANREAVKAAFRWDNKALYSVGANIFCAAGKPAEAERLKECRQVIKMHTRIFSKFRNSKVRAILASMLALEDDPDARMDLANDYFAMLRRHFKGTEYLALAALLLTGMTEQRLTEEKAARGKDLYDRMNRQHRMLTNKTDSVFAMLMAFSGKTDDELIAETEACYRALKAAKFSAGGAQTAAQILAAAPGEAADKAERINGIYAALEEAGASCGRNTELPPLAALSLTDTPAKDLAEEIRDVEAFLTERKIFSGKSDEKEQRAMAAVMIVSDQYAGTDKVNVTVMANILDMLVSQERSVKMSLVFHGLQAAGQLAAAAGKKDSEE